VKIVKIYFGFFSRGVNTPCEKALDLKTQKIMCTVIKLEDVPLIAKRDIKVYKFGKNDHDVFISDFKEHPYFSNTIYKAEFSFSKDDLVSDNIELDYRNNLKEKILYIVHGFHSFATLKRMNKSEYSKNKYHGLFIIPKGAEYYRNECDNVVSNQIIFKKFI
jgi:hypothetical protein